jgi:VTC domain
MLSRRRRGADGCHVSGVVKHFNRFELKYLLPVERVPALVSALSPYVRADPHSEGAGPSGYPIHSVYWDSPQLRCFWEKIEGLKVRRKLRLRRYGDADDVFLEIKQRVDRTLQKRRVVWPLARVAEAEEPDALDALLEESDDRVAREILFLRRTYDLRPTMGISYRRRAFFARNESDLRVTFDTRVQYHAAEPSVAQLGESGRYVVAPALAVLEIKFGHAVPLWLCKLVSHFELRMVRFSKYCSAVDRAWFGGQLT